MALATQDPREPNLLYVGWHSHRAGPALQWWAEKLRDPRLVRPLLHASDSLTDSVGEIRV